VHFDLWGAGGALTNAAETGSHQKSMAGLGLLALRLAGLQKEVISSVTVAVVTADWAGGQQHHQPGYKRLAFSLVGATWRFLRTPLEPSGDDFSTEA
jgi:hypothetical protein